MEQVTSTVVIRFLVENILHKWIVLFYHRLHSIVGLVVRAHIDNHMHFACCGCWLLISWDESFFLYQSIGVFIKDKKFTMFIDIKWCSWYCKLSHCCSTILAVVVDIYCRLVYYLRSRINRRSSFIVNAEASACIIFIIVIADGIDIPWYPWRYHFIWWYRIDLGWLRPLLFLFQ